ncbi:MAG: 50S ribosomal protein L16 [archaeon]
MALRPGRTVNNLKTPKPKRAWTRTAKRVVEKAYIVGVPDTKVRLFVMGGLNPSQGEVKYILAPKLDVLIRDNALEAARLIANKYFEREFKNQDEYHFRVLTYPHQCLREHKMLTGAGADRLSSGMRHAFGIPTGRGVNVKKDQPIFAVITYQKYEKLAKEGLERAAKKLPGKCYVMRVK